QFTGQVRRQFDIGDTRHPLFAEERTSPFLAPDQGHGDGAASLDDLIGPEFDLGTNGGVGLDTAAGADDDAFLNRDIPFEHRVGADRAGSKVGLVADIDVIPQDATVDHSLFVDDRIVANNGIWPDLCPRLDGAVAPDHDRRIDLRAGVNIAALAHPDAIGGS